MGKPKLALCGKTTRAAKAALWKQSTNFDKSQTFLFAAKQ